MKVVVAKTAGFCFGVKKAIDETLQLAEGGKVFTFGPLIHNKVVAGQLSQKGIKIIEGFNNIKDETVVLRSHGVAPWVYKVLHGKNIRYKDCTCPFVKKIHNIVAGQFENGRKIIILGDKEHPEVIGINGYANNGAIIIGDISEINFINFDNNINYCLVSQTTFNMEKFELIVNLLKEAIIHLEIFNTICNATINSQVECDEISKNVDCMIILGDKNSSNTKKLLEISKKNCVNSFLIESIGDLELNNFSYNDKIGITAGASTPPGIIKEAINTMSELDNQELSFEDLLNQSMVTLHTSDIVKGTVIRISGGEVFVNLGYKSDGIISREELSDDPNYNAAEHYNVGDEIEVYVLRVNDGEGNVLLSRKKIESQKNLEKIAAAFENKEILKGKIVDAVKGGLMAIIGGVKVFVPSSQASNRYVEDLKTFLGKELNFNILEYEPAKRRIVAGRKELAQKEEDENKKRVFDALEVGKKYQGTVRRIVEFGAFVDLGGIDGLIHISELSWGRVKKVKDVLKEGDVVDVTIIDFDKEKSKISLSLKDIKEDPWNSIEEKYPIGGVIEGKVARMVPFGVFVELEEGVDGLVHISQISSKHVVKPEDELAIGQVIKVKVTDLDKETKRISLSKKDAEAPSLETSEEVPVEGAIEEAEEKLEIENVPTNEGLTEEALADVAAEEPATDTEA
ncbi:MAG: bifunctional 4-hydroxy-3-methylbut-2-enyl diphosphate reductase/30S ribosomal protein S1 [Clostridiales bacterium]|jgi:4-hydroxy-3-methylbut-2-enyl diphosphate reductase|nr:bifunctional 4-hydroxy-3-methylbut-2-enyl diphosphate reductase/30S ribosomal protein S1 [Clostridiales bacterium]